MAKCAVMSDRSLPSTSLGRCGVPLKLQLSMFGVQIFSSTVCASATRGRRAERHVSKHLKTTYTVDVGVRRSQADSESQPRKAKRSGTPECGLGFRVFGFCWTRGGVVDVDEVEHPPVATLLSLLSNVLSMSQVLVSGVGRYIIYCTVRVGVITWRFMGS